MIKNLLLSVSAIAMAFAFSSCATTQGQDKSCAKGKCCKSAKCDASGCAKCPK